MITFEVLSRYMKSPRPFSIYLADGREIAVPHGEFVYANQGTGRFVVHTADMDEVFNLAMVTSIRRAKPEKK